MPKVWFPNIEEIAVSDDPHYEAAFVPRVKHYYPRYLYWLNPGDYLVAAEDIEPDFARYVAKISGLSQDLKWILHPQANVKPFTLAETVLKDPILMTTLRQFAKAGEFLLESYIESPRMVDLSQACGIPIKQTDAKHIKEGLIGRLNDKTYFKTLSREVGVEPVPGEVAQHLNDIPGMVRKYGQNGRAVIKKGLHGGGLGNLAGTPDEIISILPQWYHQGPIVVEPFQDFTEIIGSLVWISDDGFRYIGCDVQISENGKWRGFRYPHPEPEKREIVEARSLRYAEALHKMGARGYLNLDWGVTEDGILALEANVRHNGFGHILDYARRYFGERSENLHILYIEGVEVREGMNTQDVLKTLGNIEVEGTSILIQAPGAKQGAMLVMPPQDGHCALAFFSENEAYLYDARALAEEALA